MKIFFSFLIAAIFCTGNSKAQDTRIARAQNLACGCLDSLKSLPFKQRADSCLSKSGAQALSEGMKSGTKVPTTVEGMRSFLTSVQKEVYSSCPTYRQGYNEEQMKVYEALSANPEAKKLYSNGGNLMEAQKWDEAIAAYEKAVKLDPKFAYAYDNIAICYRKKQDYKTAIKYYQKSLEVFPAGNLALQNLAAVYSYDNNNTEALNQYNKLKYLYPQDAEGYFGAGKLQAIAANYEVALDDIFTAHLLYAKNNSAYVKDSQQLVAYVYTKMKANNQEDAFMKKAKQYNININTSGTNK
ncbi:tetratricopeptide repeat protein [Mucilaginibacter sp. PAMB04168]|uniref:tetratricopeptide repeat protein n=1 Tax=Mucilaginibacter sp. PAMB04168 TaxID=3138567 RepID=UPI0031F6CACA